MKWSNLTALPKTNMFAENQGLEDEIPFGMV